MGKLSTNSSDLAPTVVTGTLNAVANGNSGAFLGAFNLALWGTFVATLALQVSFDGGTTWIAKVSEQTGQPITFTVPAAMQIVEPEPGVLYRVACTAYTSGAVGYRLSGGPRLT